MRNKVVRTISENPICGIYQVTNKVNNKIYIGQSIDIERRWNQHRYGKGSLILRNAIKKYGIDNFEFLILEEVEFTNKSETTELLTELEQKWFDLKEPHKKGYNVNKTSKPNLTPSRDKHFGEKISKIKIENNHCGKPIKQYDLNGTFIKKWKSAAQVERVLGYHAENISGCCLKKQYLSNDFIWRFEKDILTDDDVNKANNAKRMSEVRQYNLKGELLNVFDNVKDAAEKTKLNESTIRNACNGSKKTAKGFIWKFKNEPLTLSEHINKKPKIFQFDLNGELIKIWDSIDDVVLINVSTINMKKEIIKCCKNISHYYKGCIWSYNENVKIPNKKPIRIIKNIIQKDLNGKTIKRWKSLKEINTETGYSKYHIKNCCNMKKDEYKGYKWEWG